MKFKELYSAIGIGATNTLIKTKVDPKVQAMHDSTFGVGKHHIEFPIENDVPEKVKAHVESQGDSLVEDGVKLGSGRVAPLSKYLVKSKAPKDVQDEHQNWEKIK